MKRFNRAIAWLLIFCSSAPSWATEFIKQSTTTYPLTFMMIDSADHISAKTGATVTVTLSKAGGAYGAASGAVAEVANGLYKTAGNATDTGTLGALWLHATATGCDAADVKFEVVAVDNQSASAFVSGVNVSAINSVATTSVTAVNPNLGTTQPINFTGTGATAYAKGDVTTWLTGAIPTPNVTGVPIIDNKYLLGTVMSTPATAGVQDVNVKNINNLSGSGITTIGANFGTTQPINFNGAGGTAYVKTDLRTIVGTAQTAGADLGTYVPTISTNVSAALDRLTTMQAVLDDEFSGLSAISTNVSAIRTKTNYLPSITAGQPNGLALVGSAVTITGSTVSPFILNDDHTWSFDSRDQITSPDILTESVGESTIFKSIDFTLPVTANGSISTITSVTVADVSGATEPTITTSAISTDKKHVHLTIDATSATAATFTFTAKIVTTDLRTFTRKVKLQLQ